MHKGLFNSAAAWTAIGLASGLFYREFTRQRKLTGVTQLAVAHTHTLVLGTLMLLGVLALTQVFGLERDKRIGLFIIFWNVGLALTSVMMMVKGSLQILGNPMASSPMLAGISGLGHMVLTGAFVLFFLILRRSMGLLGPTSVKDEKVQD